MKVTSLKVTNLRVIETAEFRFQPGFNLVVGVNGVGKTSVLDALAVCLSAVVKHTNKLRTPAASFGLDDIRIGTDVLTVECSTQIGPTEYTYLIHRPRETSAPQEKKAGMPREQVHNTPVRAEFVGRLPKTVTGNEPEGRPLAVLFSTRRAVPSERAPAKSLTARGIPAAYAEAFMSRELRLSEFAGWMRVQQILKGEQQGAGQVLSAFDDAVTRFVPGYSNLHITDEDRPKLLIDHGSTTLEVRQLSDGERGTLAIVLDLTRRLAQANPSMHDPAAHAEAIVLVDEIDLHLHPKWQRQIVKNLTVAFPRCQFIATTHSPQVIGEVEHDRIQIISQGQVYSPTHSFGVDSSRVLEEVMEAKPRTETVQDLLSSLSQAIGNEEYENARALLNELVAKIGEDDPEVTRARTLLEFMEDDE